MSNIEMYNYTMQIIISLDITICTKKYKPMYYKKNKLSVMSRCLTYIILNIKNNFL